MAGKIKGITIEIGGDTKPLEKALSDVNKTSRNLQSELREVEKLLKLDPGNTELLAQKMGLSQRARIRKSTERSLSIRMLLITASLSSQILKAMRLNLTIFPMPISVLPCLQLRKTQP